MYWLAKDDWLWRALESIIKLKKRLILLILFSLGNNVRGHQELHSEKHLSQTHGACVAFEIRRTSVAFFELLNWHIDEEHSIDNNELLKVFWCFRRIGFGNYIHLTCSLEITLMGQKKKTWTWPAVLLAYSKFDNLCSDTRSMSWAWTSRYKCSVFRLTIHQQGAHIAPKTDELFQLFNFCHFTSIRLLVGKTIHDTERTWILPAVYRVFQVLQFFTSDTRSMPWIGTSC